MRRFAPRLLVALLTFSLGVLVSAVRNDLRFRESSWTCASDQLRPATRKTSARGQSLRWCPCRGLSRAEPCAVRPT